MPILDRNTKTLLNKVVPLVKVQWQECKGSECKWEVEAEIRKYYTYMFVTADFEDEVLFKWGDYNIQNLSNVVETPLRHGQIILNVCLVLVPMTWYCSGHDMAII